MNMKNLLIVLLVIACPEVYSQSIDTLTYERFETGGSLFTLNTIDVNSVDAATGYNQWIINNSYSGGNGSIVCIGFPFTFTVATTPDQPAAITGGINTNYMHIVSDASKASGIQNCCFLAADGLC